MQTVLAAKKKHYIRCRSLVKVFFFSFYTFFEGVSVVLQTVAANAAMNDMIPFIVCLSLFTMQIV